MAYTGKNLVRRMEWQLDLALREQQRTGRFPYGRKQRCSVELYGYEDGSLSEKEYEDIVELLYAKEKGGKQK
jgi:hypothetical protein